MNQRNTSFSNIFMSFVYYVSLYYERSLVFFILDTYVKASVCGILEVQYPGFRALFWSLNGDWGDLDHCW